MRTRSLLATAAACVTAAPVPTPIGVGPAFQLAAAPSRVLAGARVGGLTCSAGAPRRVRAHIELFAREKVLLLPAGIGVARGGRCSYPVRTTSPTGVVEMLPSARATVGDLFAVWGQPLSPHRLAGFTGRVRAWVGGCRVAGDVRRIRLTRHAQIVIEVGGYVPPHAFFLFPAQK